MNGVRFKASLQNTLNPEVGTFDNVENKGGTFTLEDGEYYLTNNTRTSYRRYYPTKDITYSVGFTTTIEFDVNYRNNGSSLLQWCLLFNGDDDVYWFGFAVADSTLYFTGNVLPNYEIATTPSTWSPSNWLHVKCIFDYNPDQSIVHIYIDNVEVRTFTISNKYDIKYIDILGNSDSLVSVVPDAKIKNIIIYSNKKHYLDATGLTSLWSKIKSLFATKTELASKANTSDLSNYYTKSEIGNLLSQNILKGWPDGAEAHNAMWGGRDITAAFDSGEFSANIDNGTFKDIFPGDYITKQITIPKVLADDGTTVLFAGDTCTVNWVIADCNYWGGVSNHVAIVPNIHIFEARMNPTNTTEGGYAGSEMFKKIIPACATGIVNAFGSSHILTFTDAITNSTDTSHVSSGTPQYMGTPGWWEWVSVQCNLMSEKMVYGAPIWSALAKDNVMATRQMSAFRLSKNLINDPSLMRTWWLRDVVSSSHFAAVYGFIGFAAHGPYAIAQGASDKDESTASDAPGVRPFALLK